MIRLLNGINFIPARIRFADQRCDSGAEMMFKRLYRSYCGLPIGRRLDTYKYSRNLVPITENTNQNFAVLPTAVTLKVIAAHIGEHFSTKILRRGIFQSSFITARWSFRTAIRPEVWSCFHQDDRPDDWPEVLSQVNLMERT